MNDASRVTPNGLYMKNGRKNFKLKIRMQHFIETSSVAGLSCGGRRCKTSGRAHLALKELVFACNGKQVSSKEIVVGPASSQHHILAC